ncbi:glutamine synthetase family protein [Salinibacterium sp. SYSU T00001]|uniref:glutamine synthetase family protein n=1 Tax=Homoserinimonas sedimenticola TaxID=2986805 RepID=UPI0022367274|nr:glutamine synthetase family protein [Salinibacterium sedimenticola]MCW4385067.1 glutamine synthetase family protein [Salinibacterium sedimenticola]
MRNVDERRVAEGGGGASARPLLAKDRGGFIEQHELWSEAQYAAAGQMRRVMDEVGIEMVQFVFADQHGILRGKTLTRTAVPAAMRSGLRAPSTLLLKDTSGRSVFPVFDTGALGELARFSGAGDIVLVPDPQTFRVLPWAKKTGLVLCDLRFPDGAVVPFCTRSLLRRRLAALADTRDLGLTVGAELEFHVFTAEETGFSSDRVGAPGAPGEAPRVGATTSGSQLLHAEGMGSLDELVSELYSGLTLMDLPLRTIELEFGPSQLEITLEAGDAATVADEVILARMAVRQIARKMGYHATFMSRPLGADTASTGWHLHQSLRNLVTGANVFSAPDDSAPLSDTGRYYLGGLLAHAKAAAAFSTPTVNGYKRYQPFSLAPDRILWGVDNKGAMVRAVGGAGDPATRLENRSGEPAANPYLYILSQLVSGMDGLDRAVEPGEPTENPYADDADRLPKSLGAAIDALEADEAFRAALGDEVVEWFATIKRAEYDRYLSQVSDWEQREYFALL